MKAVVTLEWDDTLGKQYWDATKDGTYKVAKKIASTAKRLAPKGKTGNLRKGITAGWTKKAVCVSFVYANAPHSHLIELGHQVVRGGKLGKGGKVVGHASARPFLRPALEQTGRPASKIIEKEIRKVGVKSGR